MSRDQEKKRPSLRELFSGLRGLLESFAKAIERGRPEVRRKGEIKDLGGIKWANLTYTLSLKTLAEDKSIEETKNASRHLRKPPEEVELLMDKLDRGEHLAR